MGLREEKGGAERSWRKEWRVNMVKIGCMKFSKSRNIKILKIEIESS